MKQFRSVERLLSISLKTKALSIYVFIYFCAIFEHLLTPAFGLDLWRNRRVGGAGGQSAPPPRLSTVKFLATNREKWGEEKKVKKWVVEENEEKWKGKWEKIEKNEKGGKWDL